METPELLAEILGTDAGTDCVFVDASPANTIRGLFSAVYQGIDAGTGPYSNTQPVFEARTSDVATIVPELTVLLIEGQTYVAERLERVEGKGDQWRAVILRTFEA